MLSCRRFLHGLRPGGVYTVEDVSTSYDLFNGHTLYGNKFEGMGRTSERSVVNYFREMAHLINRRWDRSRSSPKYSHVFRDADGAREPSTKVSSWVSMVTFGMDVVIITKQTAAEHARWKYVCPKALCNDRRTAMEKLQVELAKAGVIKDKFDFSKLSSREANTEGAAGEQGDAKKEDGIEQVTSVASRGFADELMSFVNGHTKMNGGTHRINQSGTSHAHLGATAGSMESEIAAAIGGF